jgi:RNA polymerase sigma factor (sigma-70 family)
MEGAFSDLFKIMDYDRIAQLISEIKFHYIQTGEWHSSLCNQLLELTRDIPLMVCRKRGIKLEDQPDLIQKGMQEVFKNFHKIEDNRAFPRYLFITVDHLCQRYWRDRYRSIETSELSDYSLMTATYRMSQTSLQDGLIREDLREAVRSLPEKYREVIEYHYFAGYTSKEISEKLHTNMNTITSRLRRGKVKLREMMEVPE